MPSLVCVCAILTLSFRELGSILLMATLLKLRILLISGQMISSRDLQRMKTMSTKRLMSYDMSKTGCRSAEAIHFKVLSNRFIL
jgi:hypothetical protein